MSNIGNRGNSTIINITIIFVIVLINLSLTSAQNLKVYKTTERPKPTRKPEPKCGEHKKCYEGDRIKDFASFRETPFLAFIEIEYYDKSRGEFLRSNCTGTIITRRYILTSYKCVEKFLQVGERMSLRIGSNSLKRVKEVDAVEAYHNETTIEVPAVGCNVKHHHGLALIETKKLRYNLYDEGEGTSVNNICMDTKTMQNFQSIKKLQNRKRYIIFQWDFGFPHDNCVKKGYVRVVNCNDDVTTTTTTTIPPPPPLSAETDYEDENEGRQDAEVDQDGEPEGDLENEIEVNQDGKPEGDLENDAVVNQGGKPGGDLENETEVNQDQPEGDHQGDATDGDRENETEVDQDDNEERSDEDREEKEIEQQEDSKMEFLCLRDSGKGLSHKSENYQEGAPVVEEIDGRWRLIGIVTKDSDLWGLCDEPHEKSEPKIQFISLQQNAKWLNTFEHDNEFD